MSSRDSFGNQAEASNRFGARNPLEEILVVSAIVMVGTAVLGRATGYLHSAAAWLVGKHLLLARSADPILAIPGTGGVGLDLPRILIVAAVLLAVLAAAASMIIRFVRRIRHEREG